MSSNKEVYISKYWDNKGNHQKKLDYLTDKIVPKIGMGETKLELLLNGVNTFVYDLYNNGLGNLNIHVGLYEELSSISKEFRNELNSNGKLFLMRLDKAIEIGNRTESDYDYLGYDEDDEDYDDYSWESEKQDDIENFYQQIISSSKVTEGMDEFIDKSILFTEKEYLKEIEQNELIIEDENREEKKILINKDSLEMFKNIDVNTLLQVSKNELDTILLSQIELQNRGINHNGEQVGYDNAVKDWNKYNIEQYEILKNDIDTSMKPSIEDRLKSLDNKHKDTSSLNEVKYQKEDKTSNNVKEDNTSKKPSNKQR